MEPLGRRRVSYGLCAVSPCKEGWGVLPEERDLEEELLISEGSGYPSGGLWDSQSNLNLLQPWIGFLYWKTVLWDSAVFVSKVALSEATLVSCDT